MLSAMQMTFLAAVFAYAITLMQRFRVKTYRIVLMQVWAMFYPFHWYMSLSITKDTIFTGFFVLQILGMLLMISEREQEKRGYAAPILVCVSCIGVILFRNNGRYAELVLLLVVLVAILKNKTKRTTWIHLGGIALIGFIVGNLLLTGVYQLTDAQQGDRREMLSVPIQQWSRCMLYHGGVGALPEDDGTMDADARDMIQSFILDEAYLNYQADFADPVKRHVNTSATLRQPKRFIETYVRLFLQYPGEYVNAVLALDAGFLYPADESHAYINQVDYAPGKGYAQTRWSETDLAPHGFYKDSKWKGLHEQLERWAENNSYLKLPILKYLFMPGVVIWSYLILLGFFLIRGKGERAILMAFVLGYFATMLLGPTVQLRYIYPLMVTFPFMAFLGNKSLEKF
jgi:hypothetical protein